MKNKTSQRILGNKPREDRCDMCGVAGGMGKTQDTSGGHILCYGCKDEALELKLIVEDCDGLWYDYTDDRLSKFLEKKNEIKLKCPKCEKEFPKSTWIEKGRCISCGA